MKKVERSISETKYIQEKKKLNSINNKLNLINKQITSKKNNIFTKHTAKSNKEVQLCSQYFLNLKYIMSIFFSIRRDVYRDLNKYIMHVCHFVKYFTLGKEYNLPFGRQIFRTKETF